MRIVSLFPGATEILFAIGAGKMVAAVSHACDFPSVAAQLPRVTHPTQDFSVGSLEIDHIVREAVAAGQSLYTLDAATITRLAPDLIITQAQCDVCAVREEDVLLFVASQPALKKTRVLALNPLSLEDVFQSVLEIGEAVGELPVAKETLRAYRQRVAAVRQRAIQRTISPPKTLCIEWIDPLMVAAHWTPELIEMAGGRSLLATKGAPSQYTSWREIAAANPELIVVAPCGFDMKRSKQEAKKLFRLPGWNHLAAVKNGRVFPVDGNAYFNRAGPRLVESLELLAHFMDPLHNPPFSANGAFARESGENHGF